jgi:Initiator Replication protein
MANDISEYKQLPTEVRKHIAAVHIGGDLTTTERKLLNVLLLNAFETISEDKHHRLPVSVLCAMIGWNSNNLTPLKDALVRLATTKIIFDVLFDSEKEAEAAKKKGRKPRTRWGVTATLAGGSIIDGWCQYDYSKTLRDELANPEVYAIINIGIQKQFSGTYSLALYENCVRFRGTGSTGQISVDLWRQLLGVGMDRLGKPVKSAYDEFKHFNNQVIKPAIKEVNMISDIFITPEYFKTGRNVTSIKFTIESNPQKSIDEQPRDDNAVRESETYKLLRALHVSDKLAVEWISNEPEYALHVARTTSEKVARNEIRNPAGYARVLIANKPDDFVIDASEAGEAEESAEEQRERAEEEESQERSKKTRAAVAALTSEERAKLAAQFIKEFELTAGYDAEKDKVGTVVQTRLYRDYTRARAVSVIAARAA